jgi:solute carrier family 32 (vesicular inhibitory amino acid transporter)
MLSEPLAFSYAGWICGTVLIIAYGFITCYTYVTLPLDIYQTIVSLTNELIRRAKYLAGVAISDSSIRTYADIGVKAFGVRSTPLVNFFFCFEVFSVW